MVQKLRLNKLGMVPTIPSASMRKKSTIEVEIERLPQFDVLYHPEPGTRIIFAIGGRGGAKTYEVSKWIAKSATIDRKRCVILRDEKELIRESILNEVLLRFDTANENGLLGKKYDRLDTGIKDKETGEMLVITKGFRASANEKKANMKSVSNIDIAVIEEAEDIRDEQKFNTFADGVRNKGALIVVVLNTPDVGHWIIKRYFNTTPVPVLIDGVEETFYEISLKQIPGVQAIFTDYTMNPFLDEQVKAQYDAYGDPNDYRYNPHYYFTAIKGYASTGRKGQVLRKVKVITLAEYLKLPYREYYGQDFGTASPAGMIGLKKHRNTIWVRQINYKPLKTLDIGKLYCRLGLLPADLVVADNADSKAIAKLKHGWSPDELSDDDIRLYPGLLRGWNVVPCRKGPDSVTYGIDLLGQHEMYVVEESTDYWNEVRNYVYDVDKNGNFTDEPIDDHNHLIDPTRYVLVHLTSNTGSESTAGQMG